MLRKLFTTTYFALTVNNIFPFNFKMLTERNEVYNEKT